MLSSNPWEVPIVCLPFDCRLDRLRSDCIRLGLLLEVKLAERSRKGNYEQSKMDALAIISRRTAKTEPTNQSKGEKRRENHQKLSKINVETKDRPNVDTCSQNVVFINKSLPPTPPESVRTIRHQTERPQQKANFQVRRHPTIAQPFRLSSRHLEAMLEERRKKEETDERREPFRAKPVPGSTYRADSNIRIGQLKRKRTMSLADKPKPKQQNVPMRHRSVPISTYIRPNSAMEEMKKLRRKRRAMEQLTKAKGPRGMEEHSIRWRVRWSLRHSVRCLAPSPSFRHRSLSVPDFTLLHAKFQRQLEANRRVRPTTTAQPFRLTVRRPLQRKAPEAAEQPNAQRNERDNF